MAEPYGCVVRSSVAVGEVGRGDEVVGAARTHHADVALLDIEMPGQEGIRAAVAREKGWL